MIGVENIFSSVDDIRSQYPDAIIIDALSTNSANPFARLSPYYNYGDITITHPEYACGKSVNDLWQKLCVYDYDEKGNKHFIGIEGATYGTVYPLAVARKKILATAYRWMLEHKAMDIVYRLRMLKQSRNIVLLDKTTNLDMNDTCHPFAHAYLIKAYVEGLFPYEDVIEIFTKHYCYTGRRDYKWTTQELRYKIPQDKYDNRQLPLVFYD